MKKITLLFTFLAVIFSYKSHAQFGCASAVVITDGYTASNITTPGTGGAEDWNSPNPTNSCASDASYWDDDVYLYTYTAGGNDEEITMTTFTRNSWNGLGIFATCSGTLLDDCIDSDATTSSGVSLTVTATITAGQTVYIGIGQWGTPNDLDFDVTNFAVTPLVNPPSCTILSDPLDAATDVNEDNDLSWSVATGGATGYKLTVGTTSGGTDVLNNVDVGNVTTYDLGTLSFLTTYYVSIVPYNGNGDATGCTEESFTTIAAPPVGEVCGNPIVVGALPYSTTDETENYGDDYTGAPGASCSSTSSYLNGDDVVYSYSPGSNTSIDVDLTAIGSNYAGIFIYTDCADIGNTCVTGATNGGSTGDLAISDFLVSSGTTYYIVISTWASPQSTTYTLDITENTCVNATATYTAIPDCVNTQFTIDVDVTDLGSATSVTIGDDQGSLTQQVSGTGIVSFGPYASETSVNFTVTNDQDGTCVINGNVTYGCPPANNDCANPTALTPGVNFADNSVVGTLVSATDSGELATTCSSYGGGDVWYSVVVPADGNITIETNNNSSAISDTGMEVYSGACGALVSVECDDDDSGDGAFSLISLTGRTPGELLYIRVWEYGGGTEDTFQISAYNATLGIEDLQLSESFKFYPNPTNNVLNVSAKNNIEQLQLVNMLGQTVKTVTPNSTTYQLNIADLSSGIYFIKARVNNTEGTFRIVKQ